VIYPRIPVHWGDPSPYKDRLTHILIWKHWGLSLVSPGEPRTDENRIEVRPLPPFRKAPW
jgi:hypothetical protein